MQTGHHQADGTPRVQHCFHPFPIGSDFSGRSIGLLDEAHTLQTRLVRLGVLDLRALVHHGVLAGAFPVKHPQQVAGPQGPFREMKEPFFPVCMVSEPAQLLPPTQLRLLSWTSSQPSTEGEVGNTVVNADTFSHCGGDG